MAEPETAPPPARGYIATTLANNVLAYDRYEVNTFYETFEGRLPIPLAGADPSDTRVVRLHAPYTVKVVQWAIDTVCPIGVKPQLPHWNTSSANETLLSRVIRPQAPVITPGGNGYRWRVQGEYRYALTSAATSFHAGASPLSVVTAGNFVLTESDFSTAILDVSDTTDWPPVPDQEVWPQTEQTGEVTPLAALARPVSEAE